MRRSNSRSNRVTVNQLSPGCIVGGVALGEVCVFYLVLSVRPIYDSKNVALDMLSSESGFAHMTLSPRDTIILVA